MRLDPGRWWLLLLLVGIAPAQADETGSFVIRLGDDTTFVERYTRTPARLTVEQVARSPRVLGRVFTYDYAGQRTVGAHMVVTPAGSDKPSQTIEGSFGEDSARIRIQSRNAPPQDLVTVVPPGALVAPSASPWAGYEGLLMQMVAARRDSLRTQLYLLGGARTYWLTVHRVGRDSAVIENERNERIEVRADERGRILSARTVAGTARYSVERVSDVDLAALTAVFKAREAGGSGLGTLSPRDSVVTEVAGASIWIDYGRPAKRGRTIFGDLVPFGRVWRTGANAATQFRTDRALDFSGTVVPAGFYTLWTVPSPNGWELRFNGETGQWGTAHRPEKDLYKVEMSTLALPEEVERFTIRVDPAPRGGVLSMEWDATRASAAFTIQP